MGDIEGRLAVGTRVQGLGILSPNNGEINGQENQHDMENGVMLGFIGVSLSITQHEFRASGFSAEIIVEDLNAVEVWSKPQTL